MNQTKPNLIVKTALLSTLLLAGGLVAFKSAQTPTEAVRVSHRETTERLTPIDLTTTAPSPSPTVAATQPFPTSTATATASPTPTDAPSSTPTLEPATPTHSTLAMAAVTLPTPDGVRRDARVPVLMYHYVSDPPRGADSVRRDLSVTGPDFEVQLRYLANEGYHAVRLSDLVTYLQCGTTLPAKPIVLSFDDGYKDAYTVAFPLLKKYGFTGTFFIFSKPIDEENRDYLSWRDVELMSAAGMEFGSHSYSHPDLRGKPADFLTREIVSSKAAIEAHIQQPVRLFCYPSGGYDRKVVAAVRDAGYWAAVTTQQGIDHPSAALFQLTRIRVRGGEVLEQFDAALNRDWQ